jgi:hypothetical protein
VEQTWTESLKVGLVGAIGFTVSGSTMDEWLRLGIGFATFAYTVAKAGSAWLDFMKKRNEKTKKPS